MSESQARIRQLEAELAQARDLSARLAKAEAALSVIRPLPFSPSYLSFCLLVLLLIYFLNLFIF
jgi:hypothetical protein